MREKIIYRTLSMQRETCESKQAALTEDLLLTHLNKAKQYAQSYVKRGTTQLTNNTLPFEEYMQISNFKWEMENRVRTMLAYDPTSLIEEEQIQLFEQYLEDAKKFFIGNCDVLAFLAFEYFLLNCPQIHSEVFYIGNGDHVFLVVGRNKDSDPRNPKTWGNNAYICDPWGDFICKAKDCLNRDKSGQTILKNYFNLTKWRLCTRINLQEFLPENTFKKVKENEYILVTRTYNSVNFACDIKTGQMLCNLEHLLSHLMYLHLRYGQPRDLNSLQAAKIMKVEGCIHVTESIEDYHVLKAIEHLDTNTMLKSRDKRKLEANFAKKKTRILAAVEKLQTSIEDHASTLKQKYGEADPKFKIVNHKAQQVSEQKDKLIVELNKTSTDEKTQYTDTYRMLRAKLRCALSDFYSSVPFDDKEKSILNKHRDETRAQKFFGIRPATVSKLNSTFDEFRSAIKKI